MNAISLQNVTKHFRKQTVRREYTSFKTELVRLLTFQRKLFAPSAHIEALKGIDLVIPKGKTVGLVGRNGSGKSTLLKLITGIYTPSSGQLNVNGRISALLDLGAGFHPDFTGRENIVINGIILGMTRAQVKAKMDEIIVFSELGDFIDEPVRTYSSGMYMRLAFAVATHVEPDILIVDEILAVGDEHFSRKSLAKMNSFKNSGKTILLVTHDLNTVQSWCDLAAWIDGGRIRMFGAPSEVVSQYKQAVALAEKQAADTGASALSAPGLALPELPLANPKAAPFKLVEVNWPAESQQVLSAQTPTFLRLTVSADEPLQDWGIELRLLTNGGILLQSAELKEVTAIPAISPGRPAVVSASLPPTGLRSGSYQLEVALKAKNGQTLDCMSFSNVTVKNDLTREGLLDWPVAFSVEATAQENQGQPRQAVR